MKIIQIIIINIEKFINYYVKLLRKTPQFDGEYLNRRILDGALRSSNNNNNILFEVLEIIISLQDFTEIYRNFYAFFELSQKWCLSRVVEG